MDKNCIGSFEAIMSGCGFSVADGTNKVKKVLEFIDSTDFSEDEFKFLIFALKEIDIERRIDKKLEAQNGNIDSGDRGGSLGKAH